MKHAVLLLLTLGCDLNSDDASDMQKDANKAQEVANEKIVEARIDAAEAITDARADLSEEARSAQANADQKFAAAEGDFRELRENYRHEKTLALVDLDAKIADLEAKALTANGNDKSRRESALRGIAQHRAAFTTGYDGLEQANASQWDAEKGRVERLWDTLQESVNRG